MYNPAFPESSVPRYSELSPNQLVQKCAGSNDTDAWSEFMRRFQPVIGAAVLRTARQFGDPPRQLLDDLIQDTYLKLCEADSRLLRIFKPRGEESIYGYVKVVAANVAHDYFKSALAEKRGAGQTESISDSLQLDNHVDSRDEVEKCHQNLDLQRIDQTLRQVTEGKDQTRKCTIFWLRHRLGLTASEIAALPSIGLTTEGVESVLLRLTSLIRDHLMP